MLCTISFSSLLIAVLVSTVYPAAGKTAGVATLLTLITGLTVATRSQRIVAFALVGIGVVGLFVTTLVGGRIEKDALLDLNQDLVAMLIAVSFLTLLAGASPPPPARLRGRAAVFRTAVLLHVLGSIISVSALSIVGDHLRGRGRLNRADGILMARAYSSGAFWSPFWAAAAAALSFAPGADLALVAAVGSALALTTVVVSTPTVFRQLGPNLGDYRGYPISARLLRVPAALTVFVVAAHLLTPETPVPRIVALGSVAITVGCLSLRGASSTVRKLGSHLRDGVPRQQGEVTLFAAAGILAVGLGSLGEAVSLSAPANHFSVPVAWLCVLAMIVASIGGIHPVISMGVIAAACTPLLAAEPTLFALSTMVGWGAAAAVGPFSGMQMFLQARFGVRPAELTLANLPYAAIVLALSVPALTLTARLT